MSIYPLIQLYNYACIIFTQNINICIVSLCSDGCCVFYACSVRCSWSGSISVPLFMSCVHSVAVLNATFFCEF